MTAEDGERAWAQAGDYAALLARLRTNHERDYPKADADCRVCSTVERLAAGALAEARAVGVAAAWEPGLVTPQADRDCVFIDRGVPLSAASPAGAVA